MPAATTNPLPTDDEIAEAEKLLQEMHDEIEGLVGATRRFSRQFEENRAIPDVLPTHADVGRLYLFAHYLELRSWDLAQFSKEIVEALPLLGEMPSNVEIYLAREAR